MKIEKLTLRNFRNIGECTLVPDRRLNFLIGDNGQGKTSFLEAISFLATLRSFRGAKADEVVKWGEKFSEALCTLSPFDESGPQAEWRTELKLAFLEQRPEQATSRARVSKEAFINGKAYRSSTQYLSQRFGSFELGLHSIVFNPSDHDLVRGEPAVRRSYLDRVLAAEDIEYLKVIQKYQRTLVQRNALLKNEPRPSRELLSGFTEPLSTYGAILTHKRLSWLQRLNQRLNNVSQQIAPNQSHLKAVYASNWVPEIKNLSIYNTGLATLHSSGQEVLPSLELLEQTFWKQLSALEQAELRSGNTLVGPHRDDWTFFFGDRLLKGHGSQGEVRTALLALKLSEIELFRESTGHQPLLLLDDFSSELDQDRRALLLRFLMETGLQIFVTTTEDSSYLGKRFWVSNGTLRELDDDKPERTESDQRAQSK